MERRRPVDLSRRAFVGGGVATCALCAACGSDSGSAATTTTIDDRPDDGVDEPVGEVGESVGGSGAFGTTIEVGAIDDVLARIDADGGFLHVPESRAFLVRYPSESLDAARDVYDEATVAGMELGLVALHQKCTHLGCRVPECTSSGRFECPCHGAIFNGVGEYVAGPAPRGMDRFAVRVDDGSVVIDAASPLLGLPVGTSTVSSEPTDTPCVGGEH